jgi:hypothetical protein
MPVYTVHAPKSAGHEPFAETDKFVFVRDGFHFWAFVFGPLWLLVHRLWWALLGYVVLSIVGEVALSMLGASMVSRMVVMLLFAVLMGLEAASLQRWTLSRGKWRQLDVVVADKKDGAERRFFDRWTAERSVLNDQWASDRGGPPPTRQVPGQPFSRPPSQAHNDIIGLFPQPGASR